LFCDEMDGGVTVEDGEQEFRMDDVENRGIDRIA
jgi:hypothetical protein